MPTQSTLEAKPRAWVEVHLGALIRNARALERQSRTRLLPMVKADAYGLGALPVARALEALDPIAFGVSSIVEGVELRRGGISRPVIVFTPTLAHDLDRLRADELTPTLAAADGIAQWAALGGGAWHLAIETGMHRAGIAWDAVASLGDAIRACPPAGAFTHFHSAELDDGSLERQEARFRQAVEALPMRPPLLHTENSAAMARRSPSPWDCARPGVFLYGVGSGAKAAIQPEPVVHLRAQVLEVRDVASGETVSYDATWRADGTRRIATIACGYADGYRRQLGNVGRAVVGDAIVPVAGTVTMDMTMLDVTGLPCAPGDVVTLIGGAGERLLTAEDVANLAGLSPYELLTGLRQRLVRRYETT
ncbi:MAG: alanine racemase [Gemmatimonadaceae bacterium]